jgi:hypothetical protein
VSKIDQLSNLCRLILLLSATVAEMLKRLDSSPDGLSQAEAQKRLAQYGPNEIEGTKGYKDIGGEICYTNSRR